MDKNDKFIAEILRLLPEEGLKELETLLDAGDISESQIYDLLAKYDIDPKNVAKTVNEGE
ncbi:hypothetical protein IJI91_03815 [Candidatus Saccharibacteria bacterium]|nr:hypothetical protein [Candidatus Saccharibacteria bacterium]